MPGCRWSRSTASDIYVLAATVDPSLPISPFLSAFTEGTWMLYYVPLALLMLFFPTGRLLSPRWRWVVAGLVVIPVTFTVAIGAADDLVAIAMLPIFLACLIASAASLFLRYRRAGAAERLQLRWMAVAAMTIPLTLLLCWASYLALRTADLVLIGLAAMYLAVPLATAVALLRSTWFDVDELLVRTSVYAVLAGVVLAAVALVSGLAGILAARESVVVAVTVTVLTLIILLPLRRRLDAALAALVFPLRERTLRAVSELQPRGARRDPSARGAAADPPYRARRSDAAGGLSHSGQCDLCRRRRRPGATLRQAQGA